MRGIELILSCIAAVVVSCTGEDASDDLDEPAPTKGQQVAANLSASGFGEHPMRDAVDRCTFVDQTDVHVLLAQSLIGRTGNRYSAPDDEEVDELYELVLSKTFGVEVDDADDEFERQEAIEELRRRYDQQLQTLRSQPLCVEFELYFDEYDFDAEALEVADWGATKVFRSQIADPQEFTDGELPGGYAPPFPLLLDWPDNMLPMDREDADELLGQLPRVQAEGDEADDDSQQNYFTSPPRELMPATALRSLSWSEQRMLFFDAEDTRRNIDQWEEYFEPQEGTRRARAVAVFTVNDGNRFDRNLSDTFPFGHQVGEVDYLAMSSPQSDEVDQVWPNTHGEHFGVEVAAADADRQAHQQMLAPLCHGDSATLTETRMEDGQILEVTTAGCERCPRQIRGHGSMEFLWVAAGSFSYPGAPEVLVHATDCGANEGRAMNFVMRRTPGGDWTFITVAPGPRWDCEFLDTGMGTSLPLCRELGSGAEGEALDSFVVEMQPHWLGFENVFTTQNTRHRCEDTFRNTTEEKVEIDQVDDQHSQFQIDVAAQYGEDQQAGSVGESCEWTTENQEIMALSLDVQPAGIEWTEEGLEQREQLQQIFENY